MVETVHYSVMQNEVFSLLNPVVGNGLFIDCTLGEGGHTEFFMRSNPECRGICLDADAEIMEIAKERLAGYSDRLEFVNTWFDRFFKNYDPGRTRPDAVLFDLGISIFHYRKSLRGFSFQKDEDLDMRLDRNLELSAADLINTYPENELADIIYKFGEERYSRRIASAVAEYRKEHKISSSQELADIIFNAVPANYRHGRIHPATRTFQAVRIFINGELVRLEEVLAASFRVLNTGGRLAVISFHSLEDRIVKQYFREMARECVCPPQQQRCTCTRIPRGRLVTRKPVTAGERELDLNPPSRSAKLRVIEKVREEEA